jgi:phosphoglycolate phosphatase-like HAD superfamily hydrolase
MQDKSCIKMNNKHCIFDFDCTLTKYHWWKGVYNGYFLKLIGHILTYINDTKDKNNIRRFLTNIKYNQFDDNNVYKKDGFKNMKAFVEYVFGGRECVNRLRDMLTCLKNSGVYLHISTNGQANEAVHLLELVGISKNMFSYVHGYSDTRDKKVVIDIINNSVISRKFNGEELTNNKMIPYYGLYPKSNFIKAICKESSKDNCLFVDDDSSSYIGCEEYCNFINLEYENGGMKEEHFKEIKKILKL